MLYVKSFDTQGGYRLLHHNFTLLKLDALPPFFCYELLI